MKQKIDFDQLTAYTKISQVTLGHVDDDYIKGLLTAELSAKLAIIIADTGSFNVWSSPPSFTDWLFRRRRRTVVQYTLKELVKTKRLTFPDSVWGVEIDIPPII